jgi:hypothetical protein
LNTSCRFVFVYRQHCISHYVGSFHFGARNPLPNSNPLRIYGQHRFKFCMKLIENGFA